MSQHVVLSGKPLWLPAQIKAAVLREFEEDRTDFRIDDFDGTWSHVLGSSRILTHRPTFAAVRIAFFVAMASTAIASLLLDAKRGRACIVVWFFYLTDWSLVLQVVYLALATLTTVRAEERQDRAPWYARWSFGLRGVVLPLSFWVTVGYWSALPSKVRATSPITHGVNFLVMVADAWLSNMPYFLVHGLFFWGVMVAYTLFTVIHYLLGAGNCRGGKYIYAQVRWDRELATTIYSLLLNLVVVPLVNFVFWFYVRICLRRRHGRRCATAAARVGVLPEYTPADAHSTLAPAPAASS